MTEGGFVVVLKDNNNQVLMVKRSDAPFWDLPGGRKEKDETIEECAIREVREETGYEIVLDRKSGEYFRPYYNDKQHVYLGKIIGGTPIEYGEETSKLEWFKTRSLPRLIIPYRKTQINDSYNSEITIKTIKESKIKTVIIKNLKKLHKFIRNE